MRLFDLHCDTIYKSVALCSSFNNNENHISIEKSRLFDRWIQFAAVWIPDGLKNSAATYFFLSCAEYYQKNRLSDNTHKMFLTVENASMLDGKTENIELLIKYGVRAVTLTWNGDNELGSGATGENNSGLTDFGKEVVCELEKRKIAVDVSHASDKLFYDVAQCAKVPFIATHSNSRTITDNRRNLTDEQFGIIVKNGGIVGLNLYKGFLNGVPDKASKTDILRHAYHFLSLSGENSLCMGADFDGADMPDDIKGLETMPEIYEMLANEFGENIADKLFFDNAYSFFSHFDKDMEL